MSIQSEKCTHSSSLRVEDWNEMAERICAWPLPDDLCADTIACKPGAPHRTGTNLMTVTQALAMLDYACKPIIDTELTAERERADRAEAEAEAVRALLRWPGDFCLSCGGDGGHEEACRGTTGLLALQAERDALRERVARRDSALRAIKAVAEQYDSTEWRIVFDLARTALEGK